MATGPQTPISDRLIAALVVAIERLQARVGDMATEVKRLRDADVDQTAELRKVTDALRDLEGRVAPIVQSDEARGRALGKVFDRLTRLSIVQAVSMILGAFAVPVLVAGLALALTEPRAVLSVVLQVVSTATRSEHPPTTLPEDR